MIFTGITNPRNWTYCKTLDRSSFPIRIRLSSNEVRVKFITDNEVETKRGFKIQFTTNYERKKTCLEKISVIYKC